MRLGLWICAVVILIGCRGRPRLLPPQASGDRVRDVRNLEKYFAHVGVNGVDLVWIRPHVWWVRVHDPSVTNLHWLWGVGFEQLDISGCNVTSIDSLHDAYRLTSLNLDGNPITDLWPIRHLRISALSIDNTQVRDLSPLSWMPLEQLSIRGIPATDFSSIPTSVLHRLDFSLPSEGEIIGMARLRKLTNAVFNSCGHPWTFWREYDGREGPRLKTQEAPIDESDPTNGTDRSTAPMKSDGADSIIKT